MRYLSKITTTFALALVFSAGMALGQSTDNVANIDQVGDDHRANIVQNDDDGPTGNFARIEQDGNGAYQARVDQLGDNNRSTIDQTDGGTGTQRAFAYQEGDGNVASQAQNSARGNGGNVAIADIEQYGDDNVARQSQTHYGGIPDRTVLNGKQTIARIDQKGNGNFAKQSQGFSGPIFRATISQEGDMNVARQTQSGSANNGDLADVFRSNIVQNGTGNVANVWQGTQP